MSGLQFPIPPCPDCGDISYHAPDCRQILCDGCNVREPFEHRCHGDSCPCPECDLADYVPYIRYDDGDWQPLPCCDSVSIDGHLNTCKDFT